MHLKVARMFSRRLAVATKRPALAAATADKLKKAKKRRAAAVKKLKKTKKRLAAAKEKLKKMKKRLRKMRASRPGSIRSCVAFILRRLAAKVGLRRADG